MPKVGSIRKSSGPMGQPGRQGSIGKASMPMGRAKFAQKTTMLSGGREDAHAKADQAKARKP